MRIVVMDDITLSNEDILMLKSIGELIIYKGMPITKDEILLRAKGADIILTGWTQYQEGIFKELPNLKMISLWATGMDYVNLKELKKLGIKVANVPGYAKNAVAELSFALMLAVFRKIPQAHQDVRKTKAYNWQLFEGGELSGKTLGILGTGAIGVKVAKIARGFDMDVIAFDIYPKSELEMDGLFKYVDLKDVFQKSDIVTIHMPLFPETEGIITEYELSLMPKHGVIINTARAGLINQQALTRALEKGFIAGAGLDDIDLTHPTSNKLFEMEQVVLTPHIGFYTREAIRIKTQICIQNVFDFVNNNK